MDYVCKITTERTTRLVEQCPLDRYLATALHLGKSKHCKSTQSAQTPHTVMIWICFAPPRLEQLAAIKSTVNSCVSQSIVDLNRSFLQQLKLGIKRHPAEQWSQAQCRCTTERLKKKWLKVLQWSREGLVCTMPWYVKLFVIHSFQ